MSSKASCIPTFCFWISSWSFICYLKFSFFSFSIRIYACCWAVWRWPWRSYSFDSSSSRDFWRLCCLSSNSSSSSLYCSCSFLYSFSASCSLSRCFYRESLSIREWGLSFYWWWWWLFLLFLETCSCSCCSSWERTSFCHYACLNSSSTSHSYGSWEAFWDHCCFSISWSALNSSESNTSYWSASSTDFITFNLVLSIFYNLALPMALQFSTCILLARAWRSWIVLGSSNWLSPKWMSLALDLTYTIDI